MLYTTRDIRVLESVRAHVQHVNVLPERQARTLLARLAGTEDDVLPPETDRVLAATGGVALALALVGAAVGRGGRSWEEAADELERGRETYLDHPYADVFKAMQLGVAALAEELQAAYRMLAVYPGDTRVPIASAVRLWARVFSATAEQARTQLESLAARELLVLDGDTIAFHDLQRDFLLLRAGDVRLLHADLLAAYSELLPDSHADWCQLPLREPYIWEHLFEHLRGSGDPAAAHALVTDLAFLSARCFRDGPYAVESDLRNVARLHEGDPAIDWAIRLFSWWGHEFVGHATIQELAAAVALRAQAPPTPISVTALHELTSAPPLVPRWGSPEPSNGLLRVLVTGYGDQIWAVGRVWAVTYAPDGHVLASGGGDGAVRLWNPANGAQTNVLQGHAGNVLTLAFSPNGCTLASGGRDGTIRLWDAASGAQTRVLKGHRGLVNAVAFAPDGRFVASAGSDRTVRLWDLQTGVNIAALKGHRRWVVDVAFAPDGRTLASAGHDKRVRIWNIADRAQIAVLKGHTNWLQAVAYAPDGLTLASASADGTVRTWNSSGATTAVFDDHVGWVEDVAFAPDGKTLASVGSDGMARLCLDRAARS